MTRRTATIAGLVTALVAIVAAAVASLALAAQPQAASRTQSQAQPAGAVQEAGEVAGRPQATAPVVRIGFFANLTHAPALVAQDLRLFEKALAKDGTKVQYVLFNAGPAAVEAMKGGAVDVSYIGPNPAISGFASTNGSLLRIVSGVTSGGAQLVVRGGIASAKDLRGKVIATPQLGNTQDVALRSWLRKQGYRTSPTGAGDVTVVPTENATTLTLFRKGQVDGAWVPEPWASRLVLEAGGKVLLDERDLWAGGDFVTTNLIASQAFLSAYPGTVRAIIAANREAIAYIDANPAKARGIAQRQFVNWTGKPLSDAVVSRAWGTMRFTSDPLPTSLKASADDAVAVGLLKLGPAGLDGIYDLRLLNDVQRAAKAPTYSAAGLGQQ